MARPAADAGGMACRAQARHGLDGDRREERIDWLERLHW
jgi:hypothetical protein